MGLAWESARAWGCGDAGCGAVFHVEHARFWGLFHVEHSECAGAEGLYGPADVRCVSYKDRGIREGEYLPGLRRRKTNARPETDSRSEAVPGPFGVRGDAVWSFLPGFVAKNCWKARANSFGAVDGLCRQ